MKPEKSGLGKYLPILAGVFSLILLLILLQNLPIQDLLQTGLRWVNHLGIFAPLGFIVIYNISTVLLIPGSLLTLGGGAIFGLFWGSIYVFIAATLGATFAFLIGRYLSRDWVTKQTENYPQFKTIDQAVTKDGLKIVLLTRLSPLFPFNLLNYLFGITNVTLKDYILGSIGMIPGTIMYVYLGALAGELTLLGNPLNSPELKETMILQWTLKIIGLIATIAITVYVTRLARQVLDKTL